MTDISYKATLKRSLSFKVCSINYKIFYDYLLCFRSLVCIFLPKSLGSSSLQPCSLRKKSAAR